MDVNKLTRELYEVFDAMYSAMERKQRELEWLIKEVDKRIATLEQLAEEKDKEERDFLSSPIARKVISAYKKGNTIKEIAIKEGLHSGEVELIINLYRTKNESRSNR